MKPPMPPLKYAPVPCPTCGATNETDAETMCRPSTDETGEWFCPGEFRDGVSVQPTEESIRAIDAWIDRHADQ